MLSVLLVTVGLAATPAKVKLAVPEVQAVNVDAKVATFLGEHFAQQLKMTGIDVVTSREIASVLGLERQKQMLGCSTDGNTCMAELASALGADGVLLTDLAKLGDSIRINVKIVSAADGRTLSTFSDRVSSEDAAADSLTRAARSMAQEVRAALGRPDAAVRSTGGVRKFFWLPMAAGAVVAGLGALFYGLGTVSYGQLTGAHSPALSEDVALSYKNNGPVYEGLGIALISVGAAAVLAGGAMFLFGSSDASVAFMPTPNGGAAFVVGHWP